MIKRVHSQEIHYSISIEQICDKFNIPKKSEIISIEIGQEEEFIIIKTTEQVE